MRLTWEVSAGLPGLLLNRPVFDLNGRLLGIPDGLDVESASVLEYDGADHLLPQSQAADRDRDRRFADHGLTVLRVTKEDFGSDRVDSLIARMQSIRARGLRRDLARDQWTLEAPLGWTMPSRPRHAGD
jgi:hypothetical protein